MNIDNTILTETKLVDNQYTRQYFGCEVIATKARNSDQGGVMIAYRSSKF
jgi:hypothetical protein